MSLHEEWYKSRGLTCCKRSWWCPTQETRHPLWNTLSVLKSVQTTTIWGFCMSHVKRWNKGQDVVTVQQRWVWLQSQRQRNLWSGTCFHLKWKSDRRRWFSLDSAQICSRSAVKNLWQRMKHSEKSQQERCVWSPTSRVLMWLQKVRDLETVNKVVIRSFMTQRSEGASCWISCYIQQYQLWLFCNFSTKKLLNMIFSVPRTQIINMPNIKPIHHLLLSCHIVGNHVGNPNACFEFTLGFLHRDASCPEMENYENL